MADDEPARLLGEAGEEGVVDAGLDEEAVDGDAGLAGVTPLEAEELGHGLVEVGVVEDQGGAVAAELEGDFFEGRGAV